MFCALEPVSGVTEGSESNFHVSHSPDSFSAIPRASGHVFIFCAPGLVFDGTEGVSSDFHVLSFRTRFRRYRGRRVPFSCFALPDPFWVVPRAPSRLFMFRVPVPISDGTEGVGSRFHVLCSRTCFGSYRGRQVQFSSVVLPDPFWAVSRASGPVIMFCASGIIFDSTEGIYFLFCAPKLIFDGTEGIESRFHV
jgi:hypothetical protein